MGSSSLHYSQDKLLTNKTKYVIMQLCNYAITRTVNLSLPGTLYGRKEIRSIFSPFSALVHETLTVIIAREERERIFLLCARFV